jgi:hypothetical protein
MVACHGIGNWSAHCDVVRMVGRIWTDELDARV